MTQITPKEWLKVLEQAVDSRFPTVGHTKGHQYIAFQKSGYALQDKKGNFSLNEIVNLSKDKFVEMKSSFEKDGMTEREFLKDSKQLHEHTIKLIESKEAKYNQFGNRLLRGVSLGIALMTSVLGIGILLYYKLKNDDQAFHGDIAKLKETIKTIEDELDRKEIQSQLAKLPEILTELKQVEPDKARETILQGFFVEDNKSGEAIVTAFAKDIRRGDTFTRKDTYSEILDSASRPNSEIEQEKKVDDAVSLLGELVKTENDKQWILPLESMINQRSLLALFSTLSNLFNFKAVDNRWSNPISEKEFYLRVDLPEDRPPINLEIVRDQATHEINEIKIRVEGSLDACKKPMSGGESQLVMPGALRAEMTYSIVFEENRPVIKDLKRTYTAFSQTST